MKTYTDEEGLAAIETAKSISFNEKSAAIVRLFAISQVFYRQPVGNLAINELHDLIGEDASYAMFYIAGFSSGAGATKIERWAELGCIGSQGARSTDHDDTARL